MKKLIAVLISLMLLCGAALPALAEGAAKARKDETVYILAGADGSANRIIVSDHLSNPSGAATLEDVSNLEDIENVKGEQTFENGVWQAEGEDIYYQGAGKTPLPVELKISYSLNGEELALEDMAGKDGHAANPLRFQREPDCRKRRFRSLCAAHCRTAGKRCIQKCTANQRPHGQ